MHRNSAAVYIRYTIRIDTLMGTVDIIIQEMYSVKLHTQICPTLDRGVDGLYLATIDFVCNVMQWVSRICAVSSHRKVGGPSENKMLSLRLDYR
jgi:hypothetical protein